MKNLNNNKFRVLRYFNGLLSLITVFNVTAFLQMAQGQTAYKITDGSQVKVSGTSNLHDWDMLANKFNCDVNLTIKGGQLQAINSLDFILPVTNLKSKEDLMDSRAYKALKAKEYDKITFKLTDAIVVSNQRIIKVTGNLSIGGVTNQVRMQTGYVVNADESITCKGSKSIKMSDYKIKAPSFMMGALKTGDDLVINILLKLKRTELNAHN